MIGSSIPKSIHDPPPQAPLSNTLVLTGFNVL